jgi:hypothetical protein
MNTIHSSGLRRTIATVAAAMVLTVTACDSGKDMTPDQITQASAGETAPMPVEDAVRRLASQRVYFAHQSVGGNIMDGVASILPKDSTFKVVKTSDPKSVTGPAFVHFDVGKNEDPASKNADLLRVLDARAKPDSAVVLLKYCYIDVNLGTDIDKVFAGYRETVSQVRAKHPDVTLVHVTMPLTVDATGPKSAIYHLIGRPTFRDVNAKRNRFNTMLRKEFGTEPIFDLARYESTRPDGSRQQATHGGETVYALAPEYTNDGGHLTPEAQKLIAGQFLSVLASVRGR